MPLHIASTSQARLALDTTSGSTRRFDLVGDANGFTIRDQSAAVNRMTIDTSGNLDLVDGNVKVASGHGIDFSATGGPTHTGTGSSELLDDYEEGTFTQLQSHTMEIV